MKELPEPASLLSQQLASDRNSELQIPQFLKTLALKDVYSVGEEWRKADQLQLKTAGKNVLESMTSVIMA
jgi:hypothetical protein